MTQMLNDQVQEGFQFGLNALKALLNFISYIYRELASS
jgi:hypothetical protein